MIPELQRAVSHIVKRPHVEATLAPIEQSQMELEKNTLIYKGVPLASFANITNAIIALIVGWGYVDHVALAAWAGFVILIALGRAVYWFVLRHKRRTIQVMRVFKQRNLFLMMMTGAAWGMLAPIFGVYGHIGHVFLPFILAGMTSAAIVSAGACWRCVLAFNVPALLPMAAAFFFWGGSGGVFNSAAIILYGLLTTVLAFQTSSMINRGILLRTKNSQLTEILEAKADQATAETKRFKAMVESSRELTLIFSPEGSITYASPVIEELLGYPVKTVQGMTTRELMHMDDLPQLRATGEKALSTLGEVRDLHHVCLRAQAGGYIAFSGRLTNFLYVPGIEGFVFTGRPLSKEASARLHAA